METKFWISELHFNNGSKISIDKNDVVLLVGPNNSGKSATLKEGSLLLKSRENPTIVLKDIKIDRKGNESQLRNDIDKFSKKYFSGTILYYKGFGFEIVDFEIRTDWENYKNGINKLHPVFVKSLTTEERLKISNPPDSIKLTSDPPLTLFISYKSMMV